MKSYRSLAGLTRPGLNVEEKVGSLFQPDTVLPAQYFQTFRRKTPLEPEKKLILAILEDAIASFRKYVCARDPKGKMLFHEAEDWILGEERDSFFSFGNICEMLGFEPAYLRNELRRWKEKKLAAGLKLKNHSSPSRRKERRYDNHSFSRDHD